MISFHTAAGTGVGGNNNNIVTNCNITSSTATRVLQGILSYTATGENANNSITNNNIFNTWRSNGTSYSILLSTGSNGWTVTGNSIYETTAFAPASIVAYRAIQISAGTAGGGFNISNNYIGGSAPSCGGSPLTMSSNTPYYLIGVYLNTASTSAVSSLQGNTLANISISSKYSTTFRGVQVDAGGGSWNIGTVTGNTIGSATGTGSITLTCPLDVATQQTAQATVNVVGGVIQSVAITNPGGVYSGAMNATATLAALRCNGVPCTPTTPAVFANSTLNTSGGYNTINVTSGGGGYSGTVTMVITAPPSSATSYGMLLTSNGTLDVRNNRVASINVVGGSNFSHSFYGIYRNAGTSAAAATISNNHVGSATVNSLRCLSATSNGTGQSLWGIASATNGTTTISSNTIENLRNEYLGTASASYTRGIQVTTGSNTITGNTVRYLSTASANANGTMTNGTLVGIHNHSNVAGSTQIISGNTIHNLSNTHSTAAVKVRGIFLRGLATGSHTVEKNFIHSLTTASSHASAQVWGVQFESGSSAVSNNVINVGTGVNNGNLIYGIWEPGTANNNMTLHHNTVRVSGSTSNGSVLTYAMYSNGSSNTKNIRNNIFDNARTSGSGSNLHFAIRLASATGATIDHNNYHVSGTGGTLGRFNTTASATLALWQASTGQDANSFNLNPDYSTTPPTTIPTHYRPDCGMNGANALVADDHVGTARANPPSIGAFEVTQRIPIVDAMTTTSCSGAAFSVTPVNGTNGFIPAGTTYSWAAPTGSGFTGGFVGSGLAIVGTLTNTTTSSVVATYVVTPSTPQCVGDTFTVKVTVLPPLDHGTVTSADETICNGGDPANITMSVAPAGGAGTFSYQWYYQNGNVTCPTGTATTGWTSISGATAASYDPPSGLTTIRTYAVMIDPTGSPDCGPATWANGCRKVTVQNVPTAGAIASAQTICNGGDPAEFTSTTSGTGSGTITYRWESSVSPFSVWNTIAGATGATYDTPAGLAVTTQYRRITVSTLNSLPCESVATTAVQVTVVSDPSVGTPTFTNGTVCVGGSTVASATVSGGAGTLSYQWQFNNGGTWGNVSNGTPAGATYTGNTTTSLTISGTTATGAHQYRLRAYNSLGCETFGAGASFSVVSDPSVGTPTFTNGTICVGGSTVATSSVSGGTGTLTLRWQYNNGGTWANVANGTPAGTTYSGNTTASMTITGTTAVGTHSYRLRAYNSLGCNTYSSSASYTVVADPTISVQPLGTTICAGQNYIISTSVNDGTGLGYQWQYWNGSTWVNVTANQPATGFSYSGQTTASMTINTTTATPFGNNYQFRCAVAGGNGCGTVNTDGATVSVVSATVNAGFRTWTGMVDTDWDKPLNWDCGGVPTSTTNVWIPATTTNNNYPVIVNGQVANCRTLELLGNSPPDRITIQTGGTLNVFSP